MSQQTKRFYEFDRFRIDLTERVLMCGDEFVPLTQKAFEVLLALVERRGSIVSKEELLEKVWPDTFVEESNLAQNIYTLRKALGQTPDGEGYIATVPRRGYRFVANVRELVEEDQPQPEPESIKPESVEPESTKLDINAGATASAVAAAAPAPVPLNNQTDQSPESVAKPIVKESPPTTPDKPLVTIGLTPRALKILSVAALLIVAVSVAWFISHRNRGAISGDMTVTALTAAGNVLTAAISPDGAYVAYATSENASQSALWLEQLSTSTRRAIVPAAELRYYALTFSSDGGHLYYVAATSELPTRSVYRVSVLGGPPKMITQHINSAVAVSPDGSKIALRRAVDVRRSIILSVADADGKNEKEIASTRYPDVFYDPAWSPDGKMIVCAAGNPDGVGEMYVTGVSVGDWAMKTISARRWQWVGQMAWLEDSRSLVMVAQENSASPRQVWILDSLNGEARRITNDTNVYNRLSLSADAGVIAALQIKHVTNVWLIPAADSNRARQITIAAGGYRGELAWTPDDRIVYDSEAGASPAISVMESDGSGAKLLTGELTGRTYVGGANVSPDGRYALFASDLKGKRSIWRMNIDGSNLLQLTDGAGEDNPFCSPDGKWVFYTIQERGGAAHATIGRVSIDGGEMKQLTTAFTAFPSVSPDGKSFACLYAEGPGPFPWNLAIFPIEGGPPTKVFSHPLQSQTVRWTPDGSGLTYAENPASGMAKLWIQPLNGGEPKLMAEFETDRIFGYDWSRDGQYLACVRGLWATNVVLIKDFR